MDDNFMEGSFGFGVPIPPEMMEKILGMLHGMSGSSWGDDLVNSPNPEKYEYHQVIDDWDISCAIMEFEGMCAEVVRKRHDLEEADLTRKLKLKKVYRLVNEKYAELIKRGDLGGRQSGLRKWKGKFYVVAWDPKGEKEGSK